MSFPRYSAFKDSGASWLGKVPAHWDVRHARRLFEQRRDSARPDDEQLSATQKYGVIPQRVFMEQEDQKVVLALNGTANFKHVNPDDFVISLRSFQGGIERSRHAGCVSPAYTVLRPGRGLFARYWEYLLKCSPYISSLQSMTDGIRDGKAVSYSQFGAITLPLAPVSEQIVIAAFLDKEVGKIDTLIDAQIKLINLLDEKKQSLISHAVTKGLNPDVPMKESGVDSLGRVPSHWRVARLKRVLLSIDQGWSPQCENFPVSSPDEWGVLKVGCVNSGQFDPEENKKLPTDMAPVQEHIIRRGDLLISRANTRELVGRAAVVPHDFDRLLLCDKLYRLRVDQEECIPDFVSLYMSTALARRQIENQATGASSSMLNISQSVIRGLVIALPTVAEQSSILSRINEGLSKLRALSDEAARAIEILRERRSALISAAVTGKIDVRGLVEAPQEQQALESA
jgi:type I restriction enzyme S subunit